MQPVVRMRLERTIEYHEKIAEYHRKIANPEEAQTEEQAQEQTENVPAPAGPPATEVPVEAPQGEEASSDPAKKVKDEAKVIADMHAEAAKMLRDLLNAEPIGLALEQAKADRDANALMRDRSTIVARSTMH